MAKPINKALPELRDLVAEVGKQTGRNRDRFISGELDNGFAMKVAKAVYEKYAS